MKIPFPGPKKESSKISTGRAAGAVVVFFVCILASSSLLLSEFPWNGNPIAWLTAKEIAAQADKSRSRFAMDDAQSKYKSAIQTYPGDWRFYQGLALSELETDPASAEKTLKRAIELKPGNATLWINLADCLSRDQKGLGEAEKAARKAKELDSRSSTAAAQLALIQQLEKQDEDAEKSFNAASSMDKDSADYWFIAAKYHMLKDDLQRAEADLRQATAIDKSNAEYWEALGMLVLRKNDLEEAELFLRRACRLNSNNAIYWKNLGDVCRSARKMDRAEEAYRHATQTDSKNADYWLLLGLSILVQERFDDAEKPLRHALELDKIDPAKWNAYVNVLEKQKKYSEAASQLKDFLNLPGKQNMVQPRVYLARLLAADGQYSEASETLNKAKTMSKDPQEKTEIDKMLATLTKKTAKTLH